MRILVAIGCVFLVTFVAVGVNGSDCGCNLPETASSEAVQAVARAKDCDRPDPDELARASSSGEPLEWQCMIVDIIVECVLWDWDQCPGELALCEAGCTTICTGIACTVNPLTCLYSGFKCSLGCATICFLAVPENCSECVDYDITIIWTCGWVLTE
ncbi:hypothetical protein KAH43_03290 [Candidatus Bipolaricaulota bacterium]|nr:hypothetical protein [Candidatus Bipolaricaulota bacterium]